MTQFNNDYDIDDAVQADWDAHFSNCFDDAYIEHEHQEETYLYADEDVEEAVLAEESWDETECHYCGTTGQHPGKCVNCGYQQPSGYLIRRFHKPGSAVRVADYQELCRWMVDHGFDSWMDHPEAFTARSSDHIWRADVEVLYN